MQGGTDWKASWERCYDRDQLHRSESLTDGEWQKETKAPQEQHYDRNQFCRSEGCEDGKECAAMSGYARLQDN